jgi:hypothetical protein
MGETVVSMCEIDSEIEDVGNVAREALSEDATAVDQAKQTPVRIAELKERQTVARQRLADAKRHAGDAEKLAARAVDVGTAEVERREALTELERLTSGYAAAGVDAKEKRLVVNDLRIKAQRIRDSIEAMKAAATRRHAWSRPKSASPCLSPTWRAYGIRSRISPSSA